MRKTTKNVMLEDSMYVVQYVKGEYKLIKSRKGNEGMILTKEEVMEMLEVCPQITIVKAEENIR